MQRALSAQRAGALSNSKKGEIMKPLLGAARATARRGLTLRILLATATAFFLISAWATRAVAQTAPPAAEENNAEEMKVEEVVVTGSRIAAPNATSTSPIQVISSESI